MITRLYTPFFLQGKEVEICQTYKDGFNTYEITKKMGVTSKSIYNVLEKQGIPRKRYQGCCLKPFKKELITLYNQGILFASIGEKFDCGHETIISFLQNEGIPKRPENSIFAHKKPKIAQKIGYDSTTVPRILKNNGIKCREYVESVIKELYDKGLFYKEIGKYLGKAESGICHFVKSRGWARSIIKKDKRPYFPKPTIVVRGVLNV